jgi:hypothetical protein
MFECKKYGMNIMSKSPSRHLVRLQGKLKLKNKKVSTYSPVFIIFFNTPIYYSADNFSG